MNSQAFILILALSASVIGTGGLLIRSQIDSRVEAELAAQAFETRAAIAETRIARLQESLEEERERQQKLQEALREAREREIESTEVLEDRARLDRLTQARPGLIERQARKATTQVWDVIEAESRD